MEDKKLTTLTNYSEKGNKESHDNEVSAYIKDLTPLLADDGLLVVENPKGEMLIAEEGVFTQQLTVGGLNKEKICVLYFNINGSISVLRRSIGEGGKWEPVLIFENTGSPYDMLKKCRNWCLPL